ncbi:MAG TPA: aspartate--tRNA ligase, partial [Acidimicrobiales bacterium]|nr:aspartate--tRNA ligase [Acidimicrobiales bacterium]
HTGVVQCVIRTGTVEHRDDFVYGQPPEAPDVRTEYVLRVAGTVRRWREGTVNPELATGEVEIGECAVEVLSAAETPPFPIDERGPATDETLRLKHRYVDLRRDRMQHNLRLRARVNSAIRGAMDDQGFLEVETPMLMASTPEGARDFLVPSRLRPGSFYALPQSPQLFKQLSMVGGIDRYYQIARCMRDEDLRADRQLEFTQLDAEMSFGSQEDVLQAIGYAVRAAASAAGHDLGPIGRLTWQQAQERFGSDKPDVRFGMELIELTPLFAATGFNAFKAPCVKAIAVAGGASLGRGRTDALTDLAKSFGAKGLAWLKRSADDGALDGPILKFLSEDERTGLPGEAGDLLLFVADERPLVNKVLGLLRLELGRPPVNEGGLHAVWVVDFPLFDGIDDSGRPMSAHHPFTMPHEEDLDGMEDHPLKVRSQAYDLVLNGWELGSGSVRIHRSDIQQRVFRMLGISAEEAEQKFGFLLDAFRYGAPPHAGFAFGIDRLVALLAGEENIREVIAFPKTQSGTDPLTGAPAPVGAKDLEIYGLRPLPPPT